MTPIFRFDGSFDKPIDLAYDEKVFEAMCVMCGAPTGFDPKCRFHCSVICCEAAGYECGDINVNSYWDFDKNESRIDLPDLVVDYGWFLKHFLNPEK